MTQTSSVTILKDAIVIRSWATCMKSEFFLRSRIVQRWYVSRYILRKCFLKFKELFEEITAVNDKEGIDPFQCCIKIATVCQLVFRRHFLEENRIGIIPPTDIDPRQNTQSKHCSGWNICHRILTSKFNMLEMEEKRSSCLILSMVITKLMEKRLFWNCTLRGWNDWCKSEDDKRKYIHDHYYKEGIQLVYDKIKFNPGLRALAKLMLNSLWGKFGQRLNSQRTHYFSELKLC